VLLQIALAAQPPLLVAHSSMSAQVTPSPVKPGAQVQDRAPGVLEQTAFALQPPLPTEHSSMSVQVWPSPV
jgi:hypothetical protein